VELNNESTNITMHVAQGCLIVPIQGELSKEAALQVQKSLLERVHAEGVKGVVFDISGMNVVDRVLGEIFSKTAKMVKLLGASMALTGLSPGVAASIVDLNLEFDNLHIAGSLEDGLETLAPLIAPESVAINDQEDESECNEEGLEGDDEDEGFRKV
jgi:rsbT antagonist protein RsbS